MCSGSSLSTWLLMTSCGLCSLIGSVCQSSAVAGVYRVSDRFRSTKCLRQVQDYRESQTGSGLQRAVMMMKMMKVLVLGLSWVLWVSADVLHKDVSITGCSASDGEDMYALDGEEMWYADFINRRGVEPQPPFIDHISYPEGTYQNAEAALQVCQANLKTFLDALKNPAVKLKRPSSPMVYTRDKVELGEKNQLICHVTGFYPAPVKIYWTKNGEKVTEGTSINVPFYNRDGYFSQTSRLEFTPQDGDMYSCTVQHLALDSPLTRIWDVETTPPSLGPAVFCGLGLTVGLLGVAAGTFFLIKGNECS